MVFEKILQNKLAKAFLGAYISSDGDGLDAKKIDVLHILKGIGAAFLSFILGSASAVFSSYPFGIAILSVTNKYVSYCWLGLIISAVFCWENALAAAAIYSVCGVLRYALCKTIKEREDAKKAQVMMLEMFDESILIRCAIACFCAFVFGLFRLIRGGFLYYDLFGLLAGFFITPLTTLALSGIFTKNEQISKFAELSTAVLMFITVYSLKGYDIFGFCPAFALAFFLSIWASASSGALRGCAVGLISGIACGSIDVVKALEVGELSYSVATAPCILAAAGLCVGLLWKYSKFVAAAAGCIAAMTIAVAVDGFDVLSRLFPDTLSAAVIFMPLSYYGVLPKLPIFRSSHSEIISSEALITQKKQKDTTMRICALSEALGRLSDLIFTLSDRLRRPGVVDLKQVCSDSFELYCQKCSLCSLCWERESASTLDAESKITTELYTKGTLDVPDVPEYIRERCYNIEKIIKEINSRTAQLVENLIKNDRTEAFAIDYEALSKLLAQAVLKNDAEYKIDSELTKKVQTSLKYMDIIADSALCYGKRKKQVVIGGVDLARVRMGADEIRRAIENTVNTPMSLPRFHIEEDSVSITLSSKKRFQVETAKATSVKETESTNGDTAATFENSEGYFYALISDGMGSGREAAITSKLCAVFCEQMLSSGNGKAVTLEMLNGFIKNRGTECSATIDLVEIDMITAKACFVKSGAAPSYVLRGGSLYKLQSKTVPIGIMSALDAEKIRFELLEGDVIIMLSDGVAQSLEDGVWLANLLTYEWEDNLQVMADKIIDNAALNNKRSDDMSVALVRVMANEADN